MESYHRTPNTTCVICDKPIYKRKFEFAKNNGHVFCSNACYGKFRRKEKPCLTCGTPIMAQFNKKTCSRACANKHRAGIKYKLHLPRKDKVSSLRALKLRLLKLRESNCIRCGYNKIEILQIHHKDKNTRNNNIDNLELICPNCHFEEHFLEKSWLKKFDLTNY